MSDQVDNTQVQVDDQVSDQAQIARQSGDKVDYKDIKNLQRYITPTGKIDTRRRGVTSKQQKKIADAIKRARHLALLPYVVNQ
ncbi:30S ribosomal protein S18 [Candidatus Saccharibacteria bacterium]|nr:30S ribosomal protein S18 [Candidatus Saccharibacteria bacterium]